MADNFPQYPATSFDQAVDLTIYASNQLGDVINGNATSVVSTESGDIPTLRKALIDNFYFKNPIQWNPGNTNTVFNQLYVFDTDNINKGWYYAPTATATNPILMGSTPVGDANWKLYSLVATGIPAQVFPWSTEITQVTSSIVPPYEFDTAIVTYNSAVLVPGKDYTLANNTLTFTPPLTPEPDAEVPDILFCYIGKVQEGNPSTNYVTYNSLASSGAATTIGTSSGKTLQQILNDGSINWTRTKPQSSINTLANLGNVSIVSIWEKQFTDLITDKPNVNDFQTWDWAPAIQAAINYCVSYQSQTAVNAAMYGSKTLYIPAGVYPIKTGLTVTKQGSSTGSLATVLNILGDGMTSSVIQPATPGITALKATTCKVNMSNIGYRAGANYCTAWELGDANVWAPVVHSRWESVGASGFARGFVANLLFDSTFVDLFVQNITDMQNTSNVSSGIEIALYNGPANGGTTGDGSGDDSNQIVFIRPTVETAVANNSILLNVVGKSSSYAHHAFNMVGGHFETHNLQAKCYNLKNLFNANFHGVVFSQNGSSVSTMYRLGYIENCWNVNFIGGRQVTSNRLLSYSASDTKLIKITGTSKNVRFFQQHFIGPYADLSAYNRGITWLIDYSEASKGKRSYSAPYSTVSVFTNKEIVPEVKITNDSVSSNEYILTTDTSGNLVVSYSNDSTDTNDPVVVATISNTGALRTGGNIQIGAASTTSATKGIDFVNNGDQTTVLSYLRSDNVGRLYMNSYSNAQSWVMGSVSFNPTVDNTVTLGQATLRPSATYSVKFMFTATVGAFYGSGSPEGVLTAGIGSTYQRTDGGANTSFYVKESGTGNTGWVAK